MWSAFVCYRVNLSMKRVRTFCNWFALGLVLLVALLVTFRSVNQRWQHPEKQPSIDGLGTE